MFNPLIPVHLTRSVWMVVDIGAGVLLLATMRRLVRGTVQIGEEKS